MNSSKAIELSCQASTAAINEIEETLATVLETTSEIRKVYETRGKSQFYCADGSNRWPVHDF
jgi:hypothetical protein